MSTALLLTIAIAGVLILLLMVIKAKVHPFVALLVVSFMVALATGIPVDNIMKAITGGMGGLLGSITIIGLGAMLGGMIEASNGAESLAQRFTRSLGPKHTVAALTMAAFILGIPVFFEVGFIIVVPIIYGFSKVAHVSPLKFGLPMAGVMLAVHVALPTHPGAAAAGAMLGADIGWLMMVGIAIAIPASIVGYFTARSMNRRHYALSIEVLEQMQLSKPESSTLPESSTAPGHQAVPGAGLIASLIVIPIGIILLGTIAAATLPADNLLRKTMVLAGTPAVALLIALALATYFLALRRGWSKDKISDVMSAAIPTSAAVIMVAGAGGAFGKVLVESGVGKALAESLTAIHLPIIPAAFIISLALRASQGSATVAIITTSGLLSQAVSGMSHMQLVLVTLSACFGGLGLSHVNDAGFWVVTRYLGLSVADGLKTWTVLTTVMGLVGFVIIQMLWFII
ncbi:GntP family transporter [Dickeya zeae]|uniref:GntP family transporter n=1 Tax=Dickeya zeae TaxID=204042 RepID=UPI00206A7634|nr:GntP family transporter [Dickeya zeae]UPT57749.1 GntP family transporter [Dickeya zeae]